MMTARRVAAAKYDLELIKRDVCKWLSEILQLNITPQIFMETLDTGVVLCQLVELIQEKAKSLTEAGEDFSLKIPKEPMIKYRPAAKKATFHARENTKHFLDWCRDLGIRDDLIFETNGLVEHADEKRVLLCLLEVSRYAREVHIKPPDIISQEEESVEGEEGPVTEMMTPTAEDKPTDIPHSSELITDDLSKPSAHTPEPQPKIVEVIEAAEVMTLNADDKSASNHNHDIPHSIEPNADDLSKPSVPTPEPPPKPNHSSGDQAAVHDEIQRDHSPLLDYCFYPFLFSFLILILLLGGGIYFRRRK